MITCKKSPWVSDAPTGRITPGRVSAVVSSATFGVLITSSTSRRNRTLNAISSGGPSMLASTTFWLSQSPLIGRRFRPHRAAAHHRG